MSFPQHGNLLSSISGRTPKDDHKDLAVCDFKKKKKEKRTASSKNRTTSRQTYEVYDVDDDGDDNDDFVENGSPSND